MTVTAAAIAAVHRFHCFACHTGRFECEGVDDGDVTEAAAFLAAVAPLIRAEVVDEIAQRLLVAGALDGVRWQDKAVEIARQCLDSPEQPDA